MSIIKLQSCEGDIFNVELNIAKKSGVIKLMFEDLKMKPNEEVLRLINVNTKILAKVLEWASYHKNDFDFIDENYLIERNGDIISKWDEEYLNVDKDTIFKIMIASNYLDIKGLLNLTTLYIAKLIHGKTVQSIREEFYIDNDISPEDEEEIRMENELTEEY